MGGDYQSVSSHDFRFENRDGIWTNTGGDFNHKYTMKILNSLQKNQTYPVGAEVCPCGLELTETLINKLNDIFLELDDCFESVASTGSIRLERSKNISNSL